MTKNQIINCILQAERDSDCRELKRMSEDELECLLDSLLCGTVEAVVSV